MSTLTDLINSLSSGGFTEEEGQQILEASGGDLQAISDSSGFSLGEVEQFVSDFNLSYNPLDTNPLDTTSDSGLSSIDLSGVSVRDPGVSSSDPYDVPYYEPPKSTIDSTVGDVNNGGASDNNVVDGIAQGLDYADKVMQAVQGAQRGATAAGVGSNLTSALEKGSSLLGGVEGGILGFTPLGVFTTILQLGGFFDGLDGLGDPADLTEDQQAELILRAYQEGGGNVDEFGEDSEGDIYQNPEVALDIVDSLKGLNRDDLADQVAITEGVDSSVRDTDTPPTGYVRDEQGYLRDVASGQYWLMTNDGPMRTSPPLVPVPMPEDGGGGSSGGGGGGGGGGGASSDSVSGGSDPIDSEHPWTYQGNGVFTHDGTGASVTVEGVASNDQYVVGDKYGNRDDSITNSDGDTVSEVEQGEDGIWRVVVGGGSSGGGGITATPPTGGSTDVPGPPSSGGSGGTGGTGGSGGGTGSSGGGTGSSGSGGTGGTGSSGGSGGGTGGSGSGSGGTGGGSGGTGNGSGGGGTGTGNGSGTGSGSGNGTGPGQGMFAPMTRGSNTAAIFSDFKLDNIPQSTVRIQRLFRSIV